jgi:beta-lactamase class A
MQPLRHRPAPVDRIHPNSLVSILPAITLLLVLLSGCTFSGTSSDGPTEVSKDISVPQVEEPTVQPTPFTLSGTSTTSTIAPPPTETSIAEPEPTSTAEPAPQIAQSPLVETIDGVLESETGVYGVVLLNANGEYQYVRNGDVPFVAASLYKLVLLAEIYAMIEDGQVALTDSLLLKPEYFESEFDEEDGYYVPSDAGAETTVEQALFGAGAYSSNIAARTLMDLTSLENLRARAESLGMPDTYFNVSLADVPEWPERFADSENPDAQLGIDFVDSQAEIGPLNITTPNDIATFWLKLLNGEVVSPEASAAILDILRQQAVTDRIPWLLPEGVATANKTGNLYHVVHDTGLIFDPDGTLVLAVLSEGESDDDHGRQVIQRIALASTGETVMPPFTETATGSPVEGE